MGKIDVLLDIVKKRRSVRKYKDKAVGSKAIDRIIEAASFAPSGMNMQPWKFVIISGKPAKAEIRKAYDLARKNIGAYEQDSSFLEKAALIAVCCDDKPYSSSSVFMAVENMLLAATALKLGSIVMTCITEPESNKKIKQLLKIPEDIRLIALVAVGYPDESPAPKPRKKSIVSYERWSL